jgi:hypothetical protein
LDILLMMLSWLVVVAIYRVIDSALNTLGSLGVRPLLLLRDGVRSFNSTDSYHREDLFSAQMPALTKSLPKTCDSSRRGSVPSISAGRQGHLRPEGSYGRLDSQPIVSEIA